MENARIFSHVDHTLLRPTSTWEEIKKLCKEAVRYKTASVCVPPSYVKRIAETFGSAPVICTVIGFPLGYETAETKCGAIRTALGQGANEVDVVVNLGDVKNGDLAKVTEEIKALKSAAGNHILKIIIETCYLTDDEKTALCRCVTEGGADYIKTSTGFGSGGATMEDVKLMVANVGSGVRVKASGGIRTREDMELYLEAGCDRLGTSSAVAVLAEK